MARIDRIDLTLATIVDGVYSMPGIAAMSLGGSTPSGLADESSDLDIHVYWVPPLAGGPERRQRLTQFADPGSLHGGVTSWGLEDHFTIGDFPVELVYAPLSDLQQAIVPAYDAGLDGEEFTTSWLYSIAHGRPIYGSHSLLVAMREHLTVFPEPTYRAILQHRSPLLLSKSLPANSSP